MIASTFGDTPPVLIAISDRHVPGFLASRFTAALIHVSPPAMRAVSVNSIRIVVHPGFGEVETGFTDEIEIVYRRRY